MRHQHHPLKQQGGNGGGGYDSVGALNSISYSNSIEDEKHDDDGDGDGDGDDNDDSGGEGEEYSDALSGGYGDYGDDDGDMDSEAREYYNSGASELVTTVRSVQSSSCFPGGVGWGGSQTPLFLMCRPSPFFNLPAFIHSAKRRTSIISFHPHCSSRRTPPRPPRRGDGYGGGGAAHHEKTPAGASLQSHNYEPDESEVWRAYVAQQHFSNRGQWWTTGKLRALKRWMLTLVVGVVQAIIAVLCNFFTIYFMEMKYDHVYALLEHNRLAASTMVAGAGGGSGRGMGGEDGGAGGGGGGGDNYGFYPADGHLDMNQDGIADSEQQSPSSSSVAGGEGMSGEHWFNFGYSPLAALFFYQTAFVLIATAFVWIEPVAGGSGVPEIKCYMNGIDLPRIVDFKTLVCRVVGVTFSVASGLPVGKEGPMIHSGSVVAAVISQGRTKFWGVDTSFAKFSDFRNDREKRG